MVLQSGQTVTVADIDDSINADPLDYVHPNTIKVDPDAVSISDPKMTEQNILVT